MLAGDVVAIGRVLRPWGRHGAVVVEPMTHDVERFRCLTDVLIESSEGEAQPYRVREVRIDRRGRPVVGFDEFQSISDAERLRGAALLVPEEAAVRPPGDAYFNHELVGAMVSTTSGDSLGEVDDILETAAGNLLVVRARQGEILLPATRAIVREVDVRGRRIVVDPPPGLVELNRAEDKDAV